MIRTSTGRSRLLTLGVLLLFTSAVLLCYDSYEVSLAKVLKRRPWKTTKTAAARSWAAGARKRQTSCTRPADLPIRPNTLLYMVLGKGFPRLEWLARAEWPNVTLLYVSWRDDIRPQTKNLTSQYVHIFYYPNSTWTASRNYQQQRAYDVEMQQRWKFEFFIFFDEDVYYSYQRIENPGVVISEDKDHGFRLFNRNLLRDRPLRAGVIKTNDYNTTSQGFQCVRHCHFDNMAVALHRTAVDLLLPYSSKFDSSNWWLSAHIANLMATRLAPEHCVFYREIQLEVAVQVHGDYPRGNYQGDFPKAARFVDSCLARTGFAGHNQSSALDQDTVSFQEVQCIQHPLGVDFEDVLRDRLESWPRTCV